jgi:hypothetical protein
VSTNPPRTRPPGSAPKAVGRGAAAPKRKAIQHPGRFAIVAGGLTLVAILVAGAITAADTSDVKNALPDQVKSVSPAPNSIVPPQTPVVVDLRDDLIADITICGPSRTDCTAIPFDQVRFVKGLGELTFAPADGLELEGFSPGPVYVKVDYRSQADPAQDVGTYSWQFVSKS